MRAGAERTEKGKSNLGFHVCNGGRARPSTPSSTSSTRSTYSVRDPLNRSAPDARFFFATERWLVLVEGFIRLTTLQPWEAWLQPPVPDLGRGPLAGVLQQ